MCLYLHTTKSVNTESLCTDVLKKRILVRLLQLEKEIMSNRNRIAQPPLLYTTYYINISSVKFSCKLFPFSSPVCLIEKKRNKNNSLPSSFISISWVIYFNN